MMRPIDEKEYRRRAWVIFMNLAHFAILRSTDPEKQKALEALHEPRIKVIDLLEIIVPGFLDEGEA